MLIFLIFPERMKGLENFVHFRGESLSSSSKSSKAEGTPSIRDLSERSYYVHCKYVIDIWFSAYYCILRMHREVVEYDDSHLGSMMKEILSLLKI